MEERKPYIAEVDADHALKCPSCGQLNLHHTDALRFSERHPYPQGGGIRIKFWCEHCPGIELELQICQHKGTTYVEWC